MTETVGEFCEKHGLLMPHSHPMFNKVLPDPEEVWMPLNQLLDEVNAEAGIHTVEGIEIGGGH